jgi:hypothetical protein
MADLVVSKKGNYSMKRLIMIGLLVMFVLPAGAEQKGKVAFGVYSGWSLGFKPEFAWHYAGATALDYKLDFHLGGYVQYNFSDRFGLQFNLNYQHGANPWTWTSWQGIKESGTDRFSFISYNLNGIFNFARVRRMQFYLVGGVGISNGNNMYHFDDSFFNFMGGTGVRIYLNSKSASALNLAGTFHHLLDPGPYGDDHANLIRFTAGFEFIPGKHYD